VKWTTNNYNVGKRIQLHPATDQWMMGDRFGVVVQVRCSSENANEFGLITSVKIKLDRSGKTVKCPSDLYEVIA
jgi:hypothetical protein